MKDRIKKLRKEKLKLSQAEFGRKIGVSQQTVANIESGVNVLTERNFEAICRTWNVNREWLRTGVGEPLLKNKRSVESIMEEFDLDYDEAVLMAAFLELPKEYRAGVVAYVKKSAELFEEKLNSAQIEVEEIIPSVIRRKADSELTREERHAILDAELDAMEAAKKEASTPLKVFTGTSGKLKKFGKSP